MTKKRETKHVTTWPDNNDTAVQKRVKWYLDRGWALIGGRAFSLNAKQIQLTFRKGHPTNANNQLHHSSQARW